MRLRFPTGRELDLKLEAVVQPDGALNVRDTTIPPMKNDKPFKKCLQTEFGKIEPGRLPFKNDASNTIRLTIRKPVRKLRALKALRIQCENKVCEKEKEFILAAKPRFDECVRNMTLTPLPEKDAVQPKADVFADFEIDENGSTSPERIAVPRTMDVASYTCISDLIKGMRFPKPAAGETLEISIKADYEFFTGEP